MSLTLLGCSSGGSSSYATDWRSWIIANGGSISDSVLSIIDTNFFIPAANAGNILNQLDRLNIYGGIGNQYAADTNMIKNAHLVSRVSSPTWASATGYASNGSSSYLDLNYNASTQGISYTKNSNNFGCVIKNPSSAFLIKMGALEGSNYSSIFTDSTNRKRVNNNAANSPTTVTDASTGIVFLASSRPDNTTCNTIINASITASSKTSTAIPNVGFYELCRNNNGSADFFDTDYHLASWHGSNSLDYTTFRTLLNNTLIALGL